MVFVLVEDVKPDAEGPAVSGELRDHRMSAFPKVAFHAIVAESASDCIFFGQFSRNECIGLGGEGFNIPNHTYPFVFVF